MAAAEVLNRKGGLPVLEGAAPHGLSLPFAHTLLTHLNERC